ncbi:MAG TPA: spherulation-specific family 4 protein [Nitrosopumilaceae archaeon]|nr:spherulation-specific family 4 protein [Nitrosopumilaceae archaeon]
MIIIILVIGIISSSETNFRIQNVIGNLFDGTKILLMNTSQTNVMNTNQTMGIIIVPYFEPENPQWKVIYQLADSYPGTIKYAIINPCSGPCAVPLSDDWQQVISKLKSKDIKTLGYIFNDSESISNIDYYMKQPNIPTDGIFFDNEGGTNNLANFKQYADHVHHFGGIVYINPGYNYPQVIDYVKSGLADMTNIHEFRIGDSDYMTGNYDASPSKISVIVGNVYSISDMQTELTKISSKGAGIVYIYAKSYYTLPSYLNEEIQKATNTSILKN